MEIWRKRTVSTDFWVIRAFPQNFHIRKLGENLVFSLSQVQYKSTEKQGLSNKKRNFAISTILDKTFVDVLGLSTVSFLHK